VVATRLLLGGGEQFSEALGWVSPAERFAWTAVSFGRNRRGGHGCVARSAPVGKDCRNKPLKFGDVNTVFKLGTTIPTITLTTTANKRDFLTAVYTPPATSGTSSTSSKAVNQVPLP
jgi:hypothetical protein